MYNWFLLFHRSFNIQENTLLHSQVKVLILCYFVPHSTRSRKFKHIICVWVDHFSYNLSHKRNTDCFHFKYNKSAYTPPFSFFVTKKSLLVSFGRQCLKKRHTIEKVGTTSVNTMSNNLALPRGVDPRMLAFLQAQQRLQQQPNGFPQQYPQQAPGPQRPGGDADVASFLLQLKTNQNGEPVSDAEALQQLAMRNQQLQQHQQQQHQHMPLAQAPGTIPGYPQMAAMNLYPYGGIFPQANAPNAAVQNQNFKFYNPMQPQVQMHHPPQGLAPMQQPGGVVPGLNHSQPPMAMHGGPAPGEAGPVMTDAYIESLIANDPKEDKGKDSSETKPETTSKDAKQGPISAKDDMSVALVVAKDRDLIPDALFVALGQMKACRLQQCDRVGCYKTRALGFLGMTCKVSNYIYCSVLLWLTHQRTLLLTTNECSCFFLFLINSTAVDNPALDDTFPTASEVSPRLQPRKQSSSTLAESAGSAPRKFARPSWNCNGNRPTRSTCLRDVLDMEAARSSSSACGLDCTGPRKMGKLP